MGRRTPQPLTVLLWQGAESEAHVADEHGKLTTAEAERLGLTESSDDLTNLELGIRREVQRLHLKAEDALRREGYMLALEKLRESLEAGDWSAYSDEKNIAHLAEQAPGEAE